MEDQHEIDVDVESKHIMVRCGEHYDSYIEWPERCAHCGQEL